MEAIDALPADLAPGDRMSSPRMTQTKTRARWEDYLSPNARTVVQPVPTTLGLLDLETGQETLLPPAAMPAQEVTAEEPGPVAATPQPGPFEVPELTRSTPTAEYVSRIKLALIVFLAGIWGALAMLPPPKPMQMPVVRSVTQVPAANYARYGAASLVGLPLRWMARHGSSVLAVVTPDWDRLAREEKVLVLRAVNRLAENPAEVLVLRSNSDLVAETSDGRFHFYD